MAYIRRYLDLFLGFLGYAWSYYYVIHLCPVVMRHSSGLFPGWWRFVSFAHIDDHRKKWQREYIPFQKRRHNALFPNNCFSLNNLDELRKFCWCTPASIQSFLSNTIQPQCINAADEVFLGEYLTRSTPGSRRYTPWALVREEKKKRWFGPGYWGFEVQFVSLGIQSPFDNGNGT